MSDIQNNIQSVRSHIHTVAVNCHRHPNDITLIAVSKTVGINRIQEAIDSGMNHFGENYIQEFKEKKEHFTHPSIQWHFIGHLQSNKSKFAVRASDVIHSIDRLSLAQTINKEAQKINKVQKILIQVNISGEQTKSGVTNENDAIQLVKQVSKLNSIQLIGLMTMPPYFDDPEEARPFFRSLSLLKDHINKMQIPNVLLTDLSMGMTHDYSVAIEEGATMVRVGTAIFGKRN